MKKHLLILFCVFCFSYTNAQYWATDSSVWYIGIVETFGPQRGYIKAEVTGDIVIQGHNCKIIHQTQYRSNGLIQNLGDEYMYYDNHIVYHYRNNTFYTLYDFNAMPGDSWLVSVPYPSPWCGVFSLCDTLVSVVVDSVSTITIQNQVLKSMYVHSDSNDWIFANPIIETIGSAGGFFPYIYAFMDIDIPYLRCYDDSLISYHVSPPCDEIVSGLEDIGAASAVSIYPNPVVDKLNIETKLQKFDFKLYDVAAKLVMDLKMSGPAVIDFKSTSKGVYFYKISCSGMKDITGAIVRH